MYTTAKSPRFRIDQVDMHDRDERVYTYLHVKRNPETGRANVTVNELARRFDCNRNTMTHILRRLAGAQRIRVHARPRRHGVDIEVLCQPSKPTAIT